MANTRSQQTTLIAANIPDNSTGLVTPSKIREVDNAGVTAAAFVDDNNNFTGINTHTAQVRWHKGDNLASGSEITLGNTGNFHHITGNTTINSISTKQHGTRILLYFNSTPLLAHSSALFLPNATNLQVIAGSLYEFISEGGGNWRMLNNDSLNNVVISSIADDQVLQYEASTKSWKNVGFGTALGNAIGNSGTSGYTVITDGAGTLSWAPNGGPILSQFIRNLTAATVTGVTANTYLTGLLIPANTFTAGDSFDVLVRIGRNTGTATCVQNVYLNTANSISGATLIGQATIANGFVGSLWSRNLLIRSAISTMYFPSNVNANTDIVLNAFAFGFSNFDWTVNQYLVIAVQPSATTQTITHYSTVIAPH
jgi:hypothetical protein